MKKLLLTYLISCILISLVVTSVYAQSNLVQNPSFEQGSGKIPDGWEEGQYNRSANATEIKIESGLAKEGNKFVTIINKLANDSRFKQTISLKVNTLYKLSCFIKTKNVGTSQNSKGAFISIEGKMDTSKDIKGTVNEWQYVEMYVNSGNVNSMKVTVGLGGYSSINTGEASFDNVNVEEVKNVPEGAVLSQLSDSSQRGNIQSANQSPAGKSPNNNIFFGVLAIIAIGGFGGIFYNWKKNAKKDNNEDANNEDANNEDTNNEDNENSESNENKTESVQSHSNTEDNGDNENET